MVAALAAECPNHCGLAYLPRAPGSQGSKTVDLISKECTVKGVSKALRTGYIYWILTTNRWEFSAAGVQTMNRASLVDRASHPTLGLW